MRCCECDASCERVQWWCDRVQWWCERVQWPCERGRIGVTSVTGTAQWCDVEDEAR